MCSAFLLQQSFSAIQITIPDDQEEEDAGEEGAEEEEEKEDEDESFTNEGKISLPTLLRVFQHETNKAADNNRFSTYLKVEDHYEVG